MIVLICTVPDIGSIRYLRVLLGTSNKIRIATFHELYNFSTSLLQRSQSCEPKKSHAYILYNFTTFTGLAKWNSWLIEGTYEINFARLILQSFFIKLSHCKMLPRCLISLTYGIQPNSQNLLRGKKSAPNKRGEKSARGKTRIKG